MGAFRYCIKCQEALPKPTPRQDLIDGAYCPYCSQLQPPVSHTEEYLVELLEALDSRAFKQPGP